MSNLVTPTRQVPQSPGQAGRIRETPLTVEVIPSVESVPEWKTALGASKNPMAILILRRPRPSTKIDLETEVDSAATKRRKLADKDDLAIPWTCEDVDPFAPRIRNFKSSRKTRMPNNVKTYDGTGDPKDHLKIFQVAAQAERWAMPIWCHMFNSTANMESARSQKKYVKDPVEIHNIKQRDGKTIEDFMEHFKVETGLMKGAPECMRISRFMHGVNNPELTKCLNEHVPKTMEEMMAITTAFIRGEAAAASKKKGHLPWKPQDQPKRHERKFDFRGQLREGRGYIARRVQFILKKQIEELVRAGKLSHLIKEIKQSRDQTKNGKKEAPTKDKSLAIYMIQPWQRVTKQKLTQSFARVSEIKFPPLANSDLRGCDESSLIVIEVEIGGHMIHRMYIDGGSSTEVLYEHCFNQLRPEIKSQMVPATTSLTQCIVNGINGRSGTKEENPSGAIQLPTTKTKFPVDGGIVTIQVWAIGGNVGPQKDNRAMHTPEGKPRYICMAAVRYDRKKS
ncbi:hypothetical protein Tco_0670000 [Tanacetum coccineum]